MPNRSNPNMSLFLGLQMQTESKPAKKQGNEQIEITKKLKIRTSEGKPNNAYDSLLDCKNKRSQR